MTHVHTHLQFTKRTQQSCPVGLHFAILSTHTELNGEPVDLQMYMHTETNTITDLYRVTDT